MRKLRWCPLAITALLASLVAVPPAAAGQQAPQQPAPILDPIPEDPAPAGLGLVLEKVAQLPESETSRRRPTTGWSGATASTTSASSPTARAACTCPT
ncbi:hypothetical protein [Actinomadura sp. CNU-125]|uniref:hypothetical protein n=1 Tax=Actinomadura sp. CNU-125 TaxID=1904961 RepID=UPI0021CCEE82|nr:hypothetical protein [Actinomadura sp. CNU-125]